MMLIELQQAIEGLRFLAVLIQTGELDGNERDYRLGRIISDLEGIADDKSEASQ